MDLQIDDYKLMEMDIKKILVVLFELLFFYSINFLVIKMPDYSYYVYRLEFDTALLIFKQPLTLKEIDVYILNILLPILKVWVLITFFYRARGKVTILLSSIVVLMYIYMYINPTGWLMEVDRGSFVRIIVSYVILAVLLLGQNWKKKYASDNP